MAFRLRYKRSALEDLKKLSRRNRLALLTKMVRKLSTNPYRFPTGRGDYSGLRQFRFGSYSCIFAIVEEDIVLLRIGQSADSYET